MIYKTDTRVTTYIQDFYRKSETEKQKNYHRNLMTVKNEGHIKLNS